ncbi:peptidoglycan-binding protein [Xylanimonas protaetiae]|uniref:peptidoglycan-binding protein n=1 Tax=Xylanimonas protaetiae TaxID=2509457 RepID=UPI00315AD7BF
MTRTAWARAGWIGAVVAALGVGAVAGRATFVPPRAAAEDVPVATFTVVEGTIGQTLSLPVTARWGTTPVPAPATAGTVTSIDVEQGRQVSAGDVLYEVDLRPAVVAQGTVPAFRDLGRDARGEDVAQVQRFLVAGGYLAGEAGGRFDARTVTAVKAWQRALGVLQTGVGAAGDLVFVPSLPARVFLTGDVVVGAILTPGTATVAVVDAAPRFTMSLGGTTQPGVVPVTGQRVEIEPEPGADPWVAVVSGSTQTEAGGVVLDLAAADGGPVCGAECDLVPVTGKDTTFPGSVLLSDLVTGPSVPPAALGTGPDGSRFVVTPDGGHVPVTVTAVDASRAIVDGLTVGDVVKLFADAS